MTISGLRHFETTVLKDKVPGGTDPAQIPTVSTINFYRRGATVRTSTTVPNLAFDHPVLVYDIGRIAVGDVIKAGPNGPLMDVSAVPSSTEIWVNNVGTAVPLPVGTRLTLTSNPPSAYSDPNASTTPTTSITSDATTGRASCYLFETPVDVLVTITGLTPRLYVDQTPSLPLDYRNASDFRTIQEAIDDLPTSGGVVLLPSGTLNATSRPALTPLSIRGNVTLQGAGKQATILSYSANNNDDIITVTGSNVSIKQLGIKGSGSAGSGRGIYVYNAANTFTANLVVEDVQIEDTPSWCCNLPGVFPRETITSSIHRCTFFHAKSGGALFIGPSCNAIWITDCTFNGPAYGTFGTGIPKGHVHIKHAVSVALSRSAMHVIESSDTPCLSVEGITIGVSIRDCYVESLADETDTYIITTSGAVSGLVISGCTIVRHHGAPHILKTDTETALANSVIEYCDIVTFVTNSGDDVALRTGDDHMVLVHNRVSREDTGASRPITVSSGVDGMGQPILNTEDDVTRLVDGRRIRLNALTSSQREALVGVVEGTVVFDKEEHQLMLYSGSDWYRIDMTLMP